MFVRNVCSAALRPSSFRPALFVLPVRAASVTTNYVRNPKLPTPHDPYREGPQDKLLFTPGPLTTSFATKAAALRDLGSRDVAFMRVIVEVCEGLLDVAGVSKNDYTTIPVQGSGTYGIEGVISTVIPKDKGFLLIANGAYGARMQSIAKVHGIPCTMLEYPDNQQPDFKEIEETLKNSKHSHVAVVHSETTSGIINDIESVGKIAAKYNKSFIVDAMSSFGAVPIDFAKAHIDYLVSSANKCVEGLPGFSFVIARKAALAASKGHASTLTLDIISQRDGLDKAGQFRFTPPTHSLLAFHQALHELKIEGGVQARYNRYKENQRVLNDYLDQLGFKLYLERANQGPIISSYRYPTDSNWNFDTFYSKLNDRGFVIYPGKVSKADCFRIGHIGRLFPEDTLALCKAIEEVCKEMKTAGFYKA